MKYIENAICSILPTDQNAYDDVRMIIVPHALGASIAAAASGWVPGAGEVIATGIAISFVISMYYRLTKRMGLNLPRNVIKAIASVIVTEIAVYVAAMLVLTTALTFIPGLGNISGAILAGVVNYCIVQSAGELYLLVLSKLFRAKTVAEIESMSEEELKAFAKGCSSKKVIKECVKSARKDYAHVHNDKMLKEAASRIDPEKE